ncbi:LytTR family DNA-binding domain-containing protein [Devosia sp. Naph2]|uniref:LytTR family DNA-binding domain-containing protein n=1 Tax=Devosia polycyclovorans TaxID=3345148 RepID=UPI0035CF6361
MRVWLLGVVFLAGVAVTNTLTLITEAQRAGTSPDWLEPWILEVTSVVSLGVLIPAVAALERRFPFTIETWRSASVAHLAGSIAFSASHMLGMWVSRVISFRLVLGRDYAFLDDPLADALYEYRKDLLPYFIIVMLLKLTRDMLEARQAARISRDEARSSGRLTLKSGGRMLMFSSASFVWASSAGNYVEVCIDGRVYLARTTLKALLEQIMDAGVDVARIHRTLIVNSAHLREIRPRRDGDFTAVLVDGTEFRGSRRYRANVPGATPVSQP